MSRRIGGGWSGFLIFLVILGVINLLAWFFEWPFFVF